MTKKRNKKNKAKKNKTVLSYEIVIEQPAEPEPNQENENEIVTEKINVAQQEKSEDVIKDSTDSKKSLKQRFSFSRNKKSKTELNDETSKVNGRTDEDTTVRRSNSLSLHDGNKSSKIPLSKFKTLPFRKKNLSSSCGNFDVSKTKVTNLGADDWRMTGLLDNVAKSNSMLALNPSDSSNVISNDEDSNLPPVVHANDDVPAVVPAESPDKNTIEDGNVESTLSSSPDVIIEEDEQDISSGTVAVKPTSDAPTEVVVGDVPEKIETMDQECNKVEVADNVDEYDDDEQIVTVQHLCDVIRENHIELPQDIQTSDWLVLNLSPSRKPIATC